MSAQHSRRFELHRDTDVSGVSGMGIVADGTLYPSGVVALVWRGAWPTSVVFHDRGMESVEHVHGHSGSTRIVWLDEAEAPIEDDPDPEDIDELLRRLPHMYDSDIWWKVWRKADRGERLIMENMLREDVKRLT